MPNQIKKDIQEQNDTNTILEEFEQDQINQYRNYSAKLATIRSQQKDLNEQISSMSKDSHDYEDVLKQIRHNKEIINSWEDERSKAEEALKNLGRKDVIAAEEAAARSEALSQRLSRAKEALDETNSEISNLEAVTQEHRTKAQRDRLKNLYQQKAEQEATVRSAELYVQADPLIRQRVQHEEAVKSTVDAVKGISEFAGSALEGITSHRSFVGKDIRKAGSFLSGGATAGGAAIGSIFGPVGTLIGGLAGSLIGKGIQKTADAAAATADAVIGVRKVLDKYVNEAAGVLASNVGRIDAALEGTGQTYKNTIENAVDSLGINRFVKQTDYLSQIANLTSRGITYNVEQRALLETIKDKTIASFSSMDANLLRLVRLKQQDITASQFGMEAALRNVLNKVFKDSTYLQDMFAGIQGAITDAVMVSGIKDVTEYSSVIQTWMGAMYESGIDSGTVSKMASALNALGSGNVSALASDSDIQRLILLSMDTIGMDYADVLQQGLSSSDINNLLTAVVKYLTEIESNTKNNNVLTSSYTQLFGMSMSDIKAFKNLEQHMNQLQYVDSSSALNMTKHEIEMLQSTNRTIAAEQVENVISNAQYAIGSSIANDSTRYVTWKMSNMILDVTDAMAAAAEKSGEKLDSKWKDLAKGAEAAILIDTFIGENAPMWNVITGLDSLVKAGNGDLTSFISSSPSSYGASSGSLGATIGKLGTGFKTTLDAVINNPGAKASSSAMLSGIEWGKHEEKEDPALEEIKNISSALVANKEGNKAFAVFLTGMTDETLMSFASIFAPSEMENTFTGQNNILNDNWFKYGEDTTSNSTTTGKGSSTNSSTTGNNK